MRVPQFHSGIAGCDKSLIALRARDFRHSLVDLATRPRWAGRLLFALLFLFSAADLSALDPAKKSHQYSHTAWTTRDGLPHDSVRALAETVDGYLWIGTNAGLARFDGRRFRLFDRRNTPAFVNHHISALALDRSGVLWIGTNGGGLVSFQNGIFERFDTEPVLGTGRIISLEALHEGCLVGSYGGGAARMTHGKLERLEAPGLESDDVVRDLTQDPRGGLWLATYRGLKYRPDPSLPAASDPTGAQVYTTEHGLPSNEIYALEWTESGHLWLGTGAGLIRFDTSSRTVELGSLLGTENGLPDAWILGLFESSQDRLWIGTSRGLGQSHAGESTTAALSTLPTQYGVTTLFEDSTGALWIGTLGGGLHQLQDGAFTTFGLADGLGDVVISSIAEDVDGGIWIAAEGALSYLKDGRATVISRPQTGPIFDLTWAVAVDDQNRVWVGTQDLGIFRLEGDRRLRIDQQHGLSPGFVVTFEQASDGTMWAGTNGGLNRIVDDRVVEQITQADGLPSSQIRSLAADGDELWIGTTAGLSRRRADGSLETFGRQEGLSSLNVWDILVDADDRLWLATFGGGLVRFERGRGTALTTREGLADDNVLGLTEDLDGYLWLCTGSGVVRLSKDSVQRAAQGQPIRQRHFGRRDGLASTQCSGGTPAALRVQDGRLWMATLEGLSVVDPRQLHITPAPRARIEELKIDGIQVDSRSSLELAPDHLEIQIRISAPSLEAPEAVGLRYRLKSFDADWKPASEDRRERYTQLPPGRYTFQVQASDSTGAWKGPITEFDLRVQPRLYQTLSFWLVVVAAVCAGAFGLHLRRIRRLQEREEELAHRVETALSDLKVLSGLLPICAACKKVRNDGGYWTQIEAYIDEHSEASFSHALCPHCLDDQLAELSESTDSELTERVRL